jgi:predicted lipoprotein with Yx(FWY)xxD motif
LLAATGAIHLDLYLTGYRTIPTIGRLFSIQVIAAFVLAGTVLVSRNRLAATAGAGFSVATLGGYLLSFRISLFGFREVRSAAGVVAGVIEIVAFAVLAALVLSPRRRPTTPAKGGGSRFDGSRRAIVVARWAAAALSATAALLFVISLAASGPASTSAGPSRAVLMVAKIRGVQVLTNARGYTLYWFAPDTPTKSTCYGTCAVYWPPVTTRRPPAGSGLTGDLGTITR